jgi:hypothetical protein
MRSSIVCVVAGVLALTSHATADDSPPAAVKKTLAKAQLVWQRPTGFDTVAVKANRAMAYDLAIRSKKVKLEARFAIRFHVDDKPGQQVSGTALFEGLITTTVLNLAAGEASELRWFGKVPVAREFDATEGATTTFEPKAAGWTGYQRCMMVAIRRAGVAEAYAFFLFDDFAAVETELERVFHALRFAPTTPP